MKKLTEFANQTGKEGNSINPDNIEDLKILAREWIEKLLLEIDTFNYHEIETLAIVNFIKEYILEEEK